MWLAGMFIPDSTGPEVLAVLTDFEQHASWYPEVLESTLVDQEGDTLRGSHQVIKKKVLTAVLNLEYDVTVAQESPTQWAVRSVATRIAEVSNPDETPEIEYPVGNDSGFLWRLNAYWGVEEVEGGGAGGVPVALSLPRHSCRTRGGCSARSFGRFQKSH